MAALFPPSHTRKRPAAASPCPRARPRPRIESPVTTEPTRRTRGRSECLAGEASGDEDHRDERDDRHGGDGPRWRHAPAITSTAIAISATTIATTTDLADNRSRRPPRIIASASSRSWGSGRKSISWASYRGVADLYVDRRVGAAQQGRAASSRVRHRPRATAHVDDRNRLDSFERRSVRRSGSWIAPDRQSRNIWIGRCRAIAEPAGPSNICARRFRLWNRATRASS